MAATKRKILQVEAESEVKKKRASSTEDRLSDLPEALKLSILARLDAKDAVQTTLLSKKWVNLWTRIPVLNFNYSSFDDDVHVFERFVDHVLWARDPLAKLEGFKFNGHESCRPKLEASIESFFGDDSGWPVSVCESLTSLKLKTEGHGRMTCRPFLGPGSTSFKNLAVLYLNRALITDVEPFAGFRMLLGPGSTSFKNLAVLYLNRALITDVEPFAGFRMLETLVECKFWTENNNVIRLESLRLSDLTMSDCKGVKWLELRTPRLRFLEFGVFDEFPQHEGFPVLETLKFDFRGFNFSYNDAKEEEKRLNGDVMSLFSTIPNVKSLTLFSTAVLLLSLFPDDLDLVMRRGSPFRELKDLRLHLSDYSVDYGVPRKCQSVKAYLLHNCPDADFAVFGPSGIEYIL